MESNDDATASDNPAATAGQQAKVQKHMATRKLVDRYLFNAAALVVIVAGLRLARSVLVPCLLAAFIAIVLSPLLLWLKNRRVPTFIALALIMTAFTSVVFAVALMVGDSFNDFAQRLPDYQSQIQAQIDRTADWLRGYGIDIPDFQLDRGNSAVPAPGGLAEGTSSGDQLTNQTAAQIPRALSVEAEPEATMASPFNLKSISAFVRQILSGIGTIVSTAIVVLLTLVFMLLEAAHFPDKMIRAFGASSVPMKHLETITKNVRRYMAIKTATSILTGLLVTMFLSFAGIDYAILWGLLACLCNFIPNIGSIMAAVPVLALATIQEGLASSFTVALGYLGINFAVSYAIEPRFMGAGLGLSTLVILLSLFFWGWVLGPVGMLLSAPLTMIVKIVLESFDETRPLAILLGSSVRYDRSS